MSYDVIIIVAGLFLAGLLRGFTGFGLALAAVPLLALALPPQQIIPVIALTQLIAGLFDIPLMRHETDWRDVGLLALAMAAATPVGFLGLSLFTPNSVRVMIGLLVVGSVIALWRGARLPSGASRAHTIATGILSGLMNGISAMPGPPVVVYYLAQRRPVPIVRANLIAFFVLTAIAALIPMILHGLATRETALWSLIGLPGLLAGQLLGTAGFRRTTAALHRRVALISLTALATLLIARAIT